jgi:tRNA_anti-like
LQYFKDTSLDITGCIEQLKWDGYIQKYNTKQMKRYLYVALVFAILAAVYGYYEYNRPVKGIENEKPDIVVEAAALLTEFESDETNANKKYFDKIVEVSGTVAKVSTVDGKKSIYLNAGSDLSFIICELENTSDADKISVGQQTSIKGKCTGFLSDVILVQSVIKI